MTDAAPTNPQASATADAPRDAASLVIIDRTGDVPRFLMGQRRQGQVFLPNKYVFPGGRVDDDDAHVAHDGALSPETLHPLMYDMKGLPSQVRAKAIAVAAIRETYEEAGLLFGTPTDTPPDDTTSDAFKSWRAFQTAGLRPNLTGMHFFARAITPPGPPRRYDTRFFTIDAGLIAKRIPPPDDELRNLDWFTLEALLDLDIMNITRKILSELVEWERRRIEGHPAPPVPYYFSEDDGIRRVLMPRA